MPRVRSTTRSSQGQILRRYSAARDEIVAWLLGRRQSSGMSRQPDGRPPGARPVEARGGQPVKLGGRPTVTGGLVAGGLVATCRVAAAQALILKCSVAEGVPSVKATRAVTV